MVKIVVLASDILCRKTSVSNVDGLIIVYILFGLLAVDFKIDCKY